MKRAARLGGRGRGGSEWRARWLAVCLGVAGCATRSPAESPTREQAPEGYPGSAPPAPAQPSQPPEGYAQPPPAEKGKGLGVTEDDAGPDTSTLDLDAALELLQQRALELGSLDCVGACRALGSMQRARDRICDLDPERRCDDADARLNEARERVRARCGVCP